MNRVMIVVDISNLKNNFYENPRCIILFEASIRNNQNETEVCSRNRYSYQQEWPGTKDRKYYHKGDTWQEIIVPYPYTNCRARPLNYTYI